MKKYSNKGNSKINKLVSDFYKSMSALKCVFFCVCVYLCWHLCRLCVVVCGWTALLRKCRSELIILQSAGTPRTKHDNNRTTTTTQLRLRRHHSYTDRRTDQLQLRQPQYKLNRVFFFQDLKQHWHEHVNMERVICCCNCSCCPHWP